MQKKAVFLYNVKPQDESAYFKEEAGISDLLQYPTFLFLYIFLAG